MLIILSNCQYLEKHTFLNLAEHFEKHGFTGTDKITRVSTAGGHATRLARLVCLRERKTTLSGRALEGHYSDPTFWGGGGARAQKKMTLQMYDNSEFRRLYVA